MKRKLGDQDSEVCVRQRSSLMFGKLNNNSEPGESQIGIPPVRTETPQPQRPKAFYSIHFEWEGEFTTIEGVKKLFEDKTSHDTGIEYFDNSKGEWIFLPNEKSFDGQSEVSIRRKLDSWPPRSLTITHHQVADPIHFSSGALAFTRLDVYLSGEGFPDTFGNFMLRLKAFGIDLSPWRESALDPAVEEAALNRGFKAHALFKGAEKQFSYMHLLRDVTTTVSSASFTIFLLDLPGQKWYALPFSQGRNLVKDIVDEDFPRKVAKTCMRSEAGRIETLRLQGQIRSIRLIFRTPQPIKGLRIVGEKVKKLELYPEPAGPLAFLGTRKSFQIGSNVKPCGKLTWKDTVEALSIMKKQCDTFKEEEHREKLSFLDYAQHLNKWQSELMDKHFAHHLKAKLEEEDRTRRDIERIFKQEREKLEEKEKLSEEEDEKLQFLKLRDQQKIYLSDVLRYTKEDLIELGFEKRGTCDRLLVWIARVVTEAATEMNDIQELFLYIPPECFRVTLEKNSNLGPSQQYPSVLWEVKGGWPNVDAMLDTLRKLPTEHLGSYRVVLHFDGREQKQKLLDLFEVRMLAVLKEEEPSEKGERKKGAKKELQKDEVCKLGGRWLRFYNSLFQELTTQWSEEIKSKYATELQKFFLLWDDEKLHEEARLDAEEAAERKKQSKGTEKEELPKEMRSRDNLEAMYNRSYLRYRPEGWICLVGDQIYPGGGVGKLELFDLLVIPPSKKDVYFIQVKKGWGGDLRVAFDQLRMSCYLIENSFRRPNDWWGELIAQRRPARVTAEPSTKKKKGASPRKDHVLKLWFQNITREKVVKEKDQEKVPPLWRKEAKELAQSSFRGGASEFVTMIHKLNRHYVLAFVDDETTSRKKKERKIAAVSSPRTTNEILRSGNSEPQKYPSIFEELRSCKVPQLKKLLREKHLPSKGKKEELIHRLVTALAQEETEGKKTTYTEGSLSGTEEDTMNKGKEKKAEKGAKEIGSDEETQLGENGLEEQMEGVEIESNILEHPHEYCTPIPCLGWNAAARDFEFLGHSLKLLQIRRVKKPVPHTPLPEEGVVGNDEVEERAVFPFPKGHFADEILSMSGSLHNN